MDFSALKAPDEFWKKIEELQTPPTKQPTSREEMVVMARNWFGAQQTAAEAFVKAFPEHPRRWQARMIALRSGGQLRRFTGQTSDPAADRQKLEEVINAPDAPAPVKGEATFLSAMTLTADLEKPGGPAAFYEAAADFLKKYPDHPLVAQMQGVQLQVLATDNSPAGEALLKEIAASTNTEQADAAKQIVAKRQRLSELKTKPVDLKFAATDGKEIDLAQLRGKVVLVDFWASWCGPCIAEMPNVVATYKKLHPKGFEIIGISLDQEKPAMEAALKEHGMEWPQYFDGEGWKNKISSSFGIDSIPAAWLIDKKGMLRETGLRGETLASGVEKLLAE